jgi:hypothetical protein
MATVLAVLYALSCILLLAGALFVYNRRRRSTLHRTFAAGCISVALWLASLYVFERVPQGPELTVIGRLNFASVLFVAYFTWAFMRDLTRAAPGSQRSLLGLTILAALITIATPAVDRSEVVVAAQHITRFGTLFPLYIGFVVAFLGAAVLQALTSLPGADARLKSQLSVMALGIFASSAVTISTNLVLPYAYGIFALQEIGALSILAFILAAGYSITVRHLFDVRVVIRKALIITILLAFVEQVYSESVTHLVNRIPAGQGSETIRALVSYGTVFFIAVSFEPLKRWLEKRLNRFSLKRRAHFHTHTKPLTDSSVSER